MTGVKMDELMIVAISRAAQLAYVEEASGVFAYLSAADRFFRYHASRDRTATLGEELERLADLAKIDASFSLSVAAEPRDSASLFIERLSLIDAALQLASIPGAKGAVLLEMDEGEGDLACVLSRGGEKRLIHRA
jgi:hypothetical protein